MALKEVPDRYIEYALENIRRAKLERDAGKRKKYNGYKDKPERECFYTGRPCAERHEIFFGWADHQISVEYGFQVDLNSDLHSEMHAHTQWGDRETRLWEQAYQRVYMDCLEGEGLTEAQALSAWMDLMRHNYLEEVTPE